MANANFQLSIVSADQRLPSQTVDVDAEWTTIDLKRHLSRVYPGEPPVDSQKLIFAGRILTDDSKLRAVIGQEPISKTVHLVLSPSVANQAKAAVAAQELSGFTSEQMEQLNQQYLQYLSDYYKNDNGTVLNDQNGQEEFDNGDEVINVEVNLGEDFEIPENGFQRVARALGMGDGDGAPQEQGNDVGAVEQVDLFDLAYAVFRISILIAVCVTYASWQRIALVTAVGLIFYWRNGARQNEIRRRPQNPPVTPPPAQQNGNTPNSEAQSTTTTPASAAEGGDEAQPSTSTEDPQQEQVQQEPPTRVRQIVQALRGAGETSYRLVYAIFASLVPELPARID